MNKYPSFEQLLNDQQTTAKLLTAALCMLTTEGRHREHTPQEVYADVCQLADRMVASA